MNPQPLTLSPINRPLRRRAPWLAAALTAAVLALLLVLLLRLAAREDYWLDEGYTLRRAMTSWRQLYNPFAEAAPQPADPFDRRDFYDLNPPLYFALIRLVAGSEPSRLAVRGLFSAVPMVLSLLLLTLWARRTHGRPAQLAVLLLGATAPAVIYYGHEARPYALPMLAAAFLIWATPRLWARPGRLLAACLAAAAAGALMHFTFAWWIIALFIVFAARFVAARRAGDAAGSRAALAGAAGLALGSAIALAVTLPELRILAECKTSPSQPLSPEVMMNTFAFPFSRIGSRPTLPALGFALQFLFFLAYARRLRTSPRAVAGMEALGLWLIPMACPVLMKAIFNLAFYERHAFFCLPGWLMMLAWMGGECGIDDCGLRIADCGLFDGKFKISPHSAFRIPHLLLAALLLLSLAWCARNLGRPIRSCWRPVIARLFQEARPGDAYTIDPDIMAATFGLNAGRPPVADWFSFARGIPENARALWIVSVTHVNLDPHYDFDPARWRTRKLVESWGVSLYRAERVTSPAR